MMDLESQEDQNVIGGSLNAALAPILSPAHLRDTTWQQGSRNQGKPSATALVASTQISASVQGYEQATRLNLLVVTRLPVARSSAKRGWRGLLGLLTREKVHHRVATISKSG